MITVFAELQAFFAFFVDLFKSIFSGFMGLFSGSDDAETTTGAAE